jgi:hypothetical protein
LINKKCFNKFISFIKRWNSFQKTCNSTYLFICVNRINRFIAVYILFKSTYILLRSSKISSTIKYRRKYVLFRRTAICLYVSSFNLMLTYVIIIRSLRYQSSFAFNLFCMIVNQWSNFVLSSINIVEFEMMTERFVFSSRSIALMSAVISATWFTDDEKNTNDDVMNFFTLRTRSWVVFKIFNFCFMMQRANFWSMNSFCKIVFSFWNTLFFSRYSLFFF